MRCVPIKTVSTTVFIAGLPPANHQRLDALLRSEKAGNGEQADDVQDAAAGSAPATLLKLRGSPSRSSLTSMQDELAKLGLIRNIGLLAACSTKLQRPIWNVSGNGYLSKLLMNLRQHPDEGRLTWLAAFVCLRARNLTDDLVGLLIEPIQQIGARR